MSFCHFPNVHTEYVEPRKSLQVDFLKSEKEIFVEGIATPCLLRVQSRRTGHEVQSHAYNYVLLVFSVTPFKIARNKNQNRSIYKVQNLGNERRYMYKDPRQDSGHTNISYTRYPKKFFTQTYIDLYGDAMLGLTWMSSNMADGNQQKYVLQSFATKA